MNRCSVGNVLWEAFGNYLGFDVFTPGNTTGQWAPDLPFAAGQPKTKKRRTSR